MHPYLTDRLAREHADRMLAGAAADRLAQEARRGSRAASAARRSPRRTQVRNGGLTALAHAAVWPMLAMRGWLAAGEL